MYLYPKDLRYFQKGRPFLATTEVSMRKKNPKLITYRLFFYRNGIMLEFQIRTRYSINFWMLSKRLIHRIVFLT